MPLRITVTGSHLHFTRADSPGQTVTVAEATYRPVPVVHLGSASAGVRFQNVVLS